LPIMIAGNGNDLAGIMTVGAVEALAVMIFLARTINNVAQVKQESRIERTRARGENARPLPCQFFPLFRWVGTPFAQGMKPNFAKSLAFRDAFGADDVAEIHDAIARDRRYES